MEDLIKALHIFIKYGNPDWPTHCEHDELAVCGYVITEFTEEDIKKLDRLGFFWDGEMEYFLSYKFGSC